MTFRPPTGSTPNRLRSPRGRSASSVALNALMTPALLIVVVLCIVSFYAGTLWSLHFGLLVDCSKTNNNKAEDALSAQSQRNLVEKLTSEYEEKIHNLQQQLDEKHIDAAANGGGDGGKIFPASTQRYAVGMATVAKDDFFDTVPIGVAMDDMKPGDKDVLVVYQNSDVLPDKHASIPTDSSVRQIASASEAVENCEFLNVLLTHHDHRRNQCIALVPQYEAFHLYRYGRTGHANKLDRSSKLRLISRGYEANGRENFKPPNLGEIQSSWNMLRSYLAEVDDILSQLQPILEKIARDKTVIIMVCNFGQSELLANFVCSAKARNFDISMVLVFATDEETKELSQALGLATYYDERVFSDISSQEARQYGDRFFVQMMWAKAIVVSLVSLCGYNFLFQDVDIIWFQHPLTDYFHNKQVIKEKKFDIYDLIFQDDGAHSQRYTPLSANTGFYYVRYNDKTLYLLTSILLAGDLIERTNSHQQTFIAKMNEFVTLVGLSVKIISRDEEDLPGGYHYHQKTGKYLRAFFKGEKHPIIFHMSWTKNKDNKLLFFKQLGEWYLQDTCTHKTVKEIFGVEDTSNVDYHSKCCSAEPLFSCHYRDKPSIHPCKDSPPIDEGKESWWQ